MSEHPMSFFRKKIKPPAEEHKPENVLTCTAQKACENVNQGIAEMAQQIILLRDYLFIPRSTPCTAELSKGLDELVKRAKKFAASVSYFVTHHNAGDFFEIEWTALKLNMWNFIQVLQYYEIQIYKPNRNYKLESNDRRYSDVVKLCIDHYKLILNKEYHPPTPVYQKKTP